MPSQPVIQVRRAGGCDNREGKCSGDEGDGGHSEGVTKRKNNLLIVLIVSDRRVPGAPKEVNWRGSVRIVFVHFNF